ncbi:mannose-1-phosphate guanyltransferase [Marinitenerispora sediminis]|uniref:mannose-1-phosphate guanyltransferase n=1 Tax=Marinitenerispora sediminis TaxID=1931232 RepID=UPI000DF373E5|nr:mannose-1-phosphate guanyltransferase [Marinitenerispora sediminis]RCV51762.1 mannose-1-phosphate guanyltransferase [Marinitenerispora sediminis]RCV57639.1 mannose-1-phosphate guanyltransferase [Marinitenerispora sediminis]
MKAVVMAGGEGTRLRPMTANQPKPLLPVVNKPIMEHVLRLLKRHGFDDTVVTVQFLATLIRNYFGDGEELGMSLRYVAEEVPLGTAGSVKNAEEHLRGEPFIVISGDALTDIDLTDMVRFHRENGAMVTIGLKRVANPLEFGIIIVDEQGRIQRFLEKPTWGQVFSDTVNTGIYIMEPEVLDRFPAGEVVDWSGDVFPELLKEGAPLYGYIADGYWEDVGTHESYLRAQADVLSGKVDVEIDGFEMSPGVWVAEGAEVDPEAVLKGPLYIGDYAKVEAGAELREFTVLGSNVVVRSEAFLHRAVVHDNVYVGASTHLRGCVIGKNTDVMPSARIEEGTVVGEECVIESEAYLANDIKVYPFKTIEAGAVVNTNVIWESRGQRSLFGPRGVSGLINVEITPELAVRLASAYATTLKKGTVVTTSRDVSRAARTLKRAVISALTASAIDVQDLEAVPLPVARFHTGQSGVGGGIALRTSPGDPQSVDIVFLDERGADLSPAAQRKLERVFSRAEFRRAFPGEIAELSFPSRGVENYAQELLRRIDTAGISEAGLKIVVDCAGGTGSLVLPALLGRVGADVLTVNNRLDEASPTDTLAKQMGDLQRLGELVRSSGADFGVRFDPVAERLSIVDENGELVDNERALLVVLDLVAAERRGGRVALPVTTTRVAEQVARFHGVEVQWTPTAIDELTKAAMADDIVFAADGRGGFVLPEFSRTSDGIAAFVRLLGLVARTKLSLSQIDGRIPDAHLLRRSVPTPWAVKGSVMREVVEAAEGRDIDTTDGVRVIEPDGSWALVLPDTSEAVTHLWAEGPDTDTAQRLLEQWAAVVERAEG